MINKSLHTSNGVRCHLRRVVTSTYSLGTPLYISVNKRGLPLGMEIVQSRCNISENGETHSWDKGLEGRGGEGRGGEGRGGKRFMECFTALC